MQMKTHDVSPVARLRHPFSKIINKHLTRRSPPQAGGNTHTHTHGCWAATAAVSQGCSGSLLTQRNDTAREDYINGS